MKLDHISAIPYDLELRDLIDSCLYRLDQLENAATECVKLDDQLSTEHLDSDVLQQKVATHTRIFDLLEAFLAGWARLSLLLFPDDSTAFTQHRGQILQRILDLRDSSVFADRALRNSWMHFDERLDRAVAAGTGANRHLFTRSREVTEAQKRGTLRIIEIDTLRVHYHDRGSQPRCVDLRELRAALDELENRRRTARQLLPMPPDEPA